VTEPKPKISAEFAARLAKLDPAVTLRAIVLPVRGAFDQPTPPPGVRVRGAEREAALRAAKARTVSGFAQLDAVLDEAGGRRVSESGTALGYIVVETTPQGIESICALDWVGAILEDQSIYSIA
jgi:hypothetical protein